MILKHHFTYNSNKVDVYYYVDRYRYCVHTDKGIEYRELECEPCHNAFILQELLIADIHTFKYQAPQMSAKCIRCSKHCGAPRKEYTLASLCDRCYQVIKVMEETTDTNNTAGITWYEINLDGSKGQVIKKETI